MSEIVLYEQGTPVDPPAAGQRKVYIKSDGQLYVQDSSGTESSPAGSSAGETLSVTSPGTTAVGAQYSTVLVMTSTAAGGSTLQLPNAGDREGEEVFIIDFEGGAAEHPISVASSASSGGVLGKNVIQYGFGSLRFRALSNAWVAVTPGAFVTPFVVGTNGWEPFPMLADAVDQAAALFAQSGVPQVVLVAPGEYTEDLTFQNGVHLRALVSASVISRNSNVTDGASRVTVIGNHSFAAGGEMYVSIDGLTFIENDGATPVIAYDSSAGGKFDAHVVFRNCSFLHSTDAPATAPLIVCEERSTNWEFVDFHDCYFRAYRADIAFAFSGETSHYTLRRCVVRNLSLVANSLRADGGCTFEVVDCPEVVPLDVKDTGTVATLRNTNVDSEADLPAVTVGTGAALYIYPGCAFRASVPRVVVGGVGQVRFYGSPEVSLGGTFESTLVISTRSAVRRGSTITYTPVAPGTEQVPLDVVLVQTDTTSAAMTLDLPDPAEAGAGKPLVVWDYGESSTSNPVTITCSVGSVYGVASLSTDGQRLTFVSDGSSRWIQTASAT